jgi:hypothetical protein
MNKYIVLVVLLVLCALSVVHGLRPVSGKIVDTTCINKCRNYPRGRNHLLCFEDCKAQQQAILSEGDFQSQLKKCLQGCDSKPNKKTCQIACYRSRYF